MLDLSGIGRDRLQLRWVSAAEGQIFADFVKELSNLTTELGPFDPARHELALSAMDKALNAPRLRWLLGMDRQVTERENVYHQKIDGAKFEQILKVAVEEEYQKALILQVLSDGPKSVREIAGKSSLPIYTVSLLLSDIEKEGQVEFHGYEGTTPKFISLAA
jgi:hypothetical protein